MKGPCDQRMEASTAGRGRCSLTPRGSDAVCVGAPQPRLWPAYRAPRGPAARGAEDGWDLGMAGQVLPDSGLRLPHLCLRVPMPHGVTAPSQWGRLFSVSIWKHQCP